MFTGIIQSIGVIAAAAARDGDLRLEVDAPGIEPSRMALGDSVAVGGVCLTVAARTARGFAADVSRETLALTTAGRWRPGERVNLEPALRAGDALGGHLVSGHVDGRAVLLDRSGDARSQRLRFRAPVELARYVARKGSVALDGVSLTVNDVAGAEFGVNLIPHTLSVTTLGGLEPGGEVNFEIDVIARYVERMAGFGDVQLPPRVRP